MRNENFLQTNILWKNEPFMMVNTIKNRPSSAEPISHGKNLFVIISGNQGCLVYFQTKTDSWE